MVPPVPRPETKKSRLNPAERASSSISGPVSWECALMLPGLCYWFSMNEPGVLRWMRLAVSY